MKMHNKSQPHPRSAPTGNGGGVFGYRFQGDQNRKPEVVDRFWGKVNKTDSCWEWLGWKRDGYGIFDINAKKIGAHRWSYEMHKGPIPAGLYVDHICFNRACVNPDHLRVATPGANQEYRNGATRANKRTGVRGVYPSGRGYMVKVQHKGEQIYLGTYDTIQEAEAVAIQERNRRFTFPEREAA